MIVEPQVLGAFVLAVAALVLSPGPDTVLILRYTVAAGRRTGLATVAGVQLGLLAHTAAAAGGLSLLVHASPALFKAVAVAGAAYLAWLGVQSFRAGVLKMDGAAGFVPPAKALRDAMLTNILNPKVIVLFLALMPGFVRVEKGAVPAQLAVLGLTLIAVNVVWQAGLALGADTVRRWLAGPRVQRAVAWITGTVLIAFAIGMLAEHVL